MTEVNGKPKKPLYKRVWVWIVGLILVVVLGQAVSGGGDSGAPAAAPAASPTVEAAPSTESSAPAPTSAEATTAAPAPTPTVASPEEEVADDLSDDEWAASDIQVERSEFGDSVTARVTNNADGPRTGVFTLTIFDASGERIGQTMGSASDVAPGDTDTVTFIGSTEPFPGDPATYSFEFQSDF